MKDLDQVKESPGVVDARSTLESLRGYPLEAQAFFFENAVKPHGISNWLRDYELDEGFEDLREEIYSISARLETLPGKQLLAELQGSLNASVNPIEYRDASDFITEDSPFFPSSVDAIDEMMGGFYGVTVLAGAPKVGKSLMAIGCAVEASRAEKPWKVFYCNAEMSDAQFIGRLRNYMGRVDPTVADNLKIVNVTTGITQELLLKSFEEDDRVRYGDERILIVVDSINRVVDMGTQTDTESGYWKLLRDWSAWAMNSRRSSEGKISWLIVSELAQHGGVKGRNLEYLADTVIRINSTGTDDIVEVDIPFSRATRSGYIGAMRRDFKTGRFLRGN